MLFRRGRCVLVFHPQTNNEERKQELSLGTFPSFGKVFLIARLRASLTVEAALVLPLFLICMLSVGRLMNVYSYSTRLCCALAQTAEEMGIAAYTEKFGGEPLIRAGVGLAYARSRTLSMTGNRRSVRGESFLLSSLAGGDHEIRLVLTYRPAGSGLWRLPGMRFIQRASVRKWTGREGSSGGDTAASQEKEEKTVFVTEYGSVYHTDINCTHIKLKIEQVPKGEAAVRRNRYGEKYHTCELCGRYAGENVYITTDGNRYHSSLQCAGLKRSVKAVDIHEAGELRPCSKCAGGAHG